MTPFDQDRFLAQLERHFRSFGKPAPKGEDAVFWYSELKFLPVDLVIRALEIHVGAEQKFPQPASVADVKRIVSRLRREGDAAMEHAAPQCLSADEHGRCSLPAEANPAGGRYSGFCDKHVRFHTSFMLLASRMPLDLVRRDPGMGPMMIKALETFRPYPPPAASQRRPMAPVMDRVLPPAPRTAEVLADREPGVDDGP